MNNTFNFNQLKPINYTRKSSESEDRQMLSISSQRDEAERIRAFYKLPNFIETFEEAKSAKKEFCRQGFSKMIELIRKGKADTIVCWKLDRLARNMSEGGMIIDLISSGIIKAIITHDKVYYPTDNVLLMAVEFGQGKQFVKDLSVNVKRGQTKKAELGTPHGVAALGFLNDRSEEKGNRKWMVDTVRLPLIKLTFERFLTGEYSAGKLYKYAINDLNLTTVSRKRTGGAHITLSRIYEILKDPIYAGFFYYNGKRYELDTSLPRIISEAEHEKVKSFLSRNNIPKNYTHESAYSGFITSPENNFVGPDIKLQVICECKKKFSYSNRTHCPSCGLELDKSNNAKFLRYEYYYNVKKKKSGEKYKYISRADIDNKISELFVEHLAFSPELVAWSKKYIHELKDKQIEDNIVVQQRKVQRKEEFEEKKAKLRSMYRDSKFTEEEYKEDAVRLENEYKDIKIAATENEWYKRMIEIADLSGEVAKIFQSDDIRAKRSLLSKLGPNLIWDEENLLIINTNEINTLIEGIKSAKSKIPWFEPKNFVVNKGVNEKIPSENEIFSTMLRG